MHVPASKGCLLGVGGTVEGMLPFLEGVSCQFGCAASQAEQGQEDHAGNILMALLSSLGCCCL